jgi:hypothetical protein
MIGGRATRSGSSIVGGRKLGIGRSSWIDLMTRCSTTIMEITDE